jgi:transposase
MKTPKKTTPNYRFFIGIDVAKLSLAVYLYDSQTGQGYHFNVENIPEGFAQLQAWLLGHQAHKKQTLICSEHTGRYGEHLSVWLADNGWAHGLLNTTASSKVAPEHHRKTDSFDAELLAEYTRRYADKIALAQPVPDYIRQLERLRRERRFLVDCRTSMRQKLSEIRYHATDTAVFKKIYREHVDLFTKQIKQINARIKQLIASRADLTLINKRLLSIPGIGPVIAAQWICLFFQQDHLNARKISSRFGFAPHEIESGSSVRKRKRSSRHGNPEMRRMMFQAARSVVQHKAHFKQYYARKLEEGKHHRVIMNNVINKLIRRMCSIWNQKTCYDPNFLLTKS